MYDAFEKMRRPQLVGVLLCVWCPGAGFSDARKPAGLASRASTDIVSREYRLAGSMQEKRNMAHAFDAGSCT